MQEFIEVKTEKIKKIKKIGKFDVYNMEVKDHHNFAVNGGFIVHNCVDALRYALNKYINGVKPAQAFDKRLFLGGIY